jgi:hypothetical protein
MMGFFVAARVAAVMVRTLSGSEPMRMPPLSACGQETLISYPSAMSPARSNASTEWANFSPVLSPIWAMRNTSGGVASLSSRKPSTVASSPGFV